MVDEQIEPAYRINQWHRYEATTRKPAKKMQWLPIFVHGHSVGAGYSRLAKLAGAQLGNTFATFVKCLELAAAVPLDQPRDGTVWNHRDEPATAAEIAEYSLLPEARVVQALRWLINPKCGWICADARKNAHACTNSPYRTGPKPKPKGPDRTGQDRTGPNRTEQDPAEKISDFCADGDSSASDFGKNKPRTPAGWKIWTVYQLVKIFATRLKTKQGSADQTCWEDIADQVVECEGEALSVVALARDKAACRSAKNRRAVFIAAAKKKFAYKPRRHVAELPGKETAV